MSEAVVVEPLTTPAFLGFGNIGSALDAHPPRAAIAGLERVDPFDALFAEDPKMRAALAWARRIARSDLPVMLLAETGAGKELVAQAIHAASARADRPFVPVNCGSIAPSLLESELFGYAPGSFTGAERRGHAGVLEEASGGTLFLDEVAEMPLAMQVALLRVLETGTYRRVGETRLSSADVRIICATCEDLPRLVDEGRFRRDLFFRLKGGLVTLPPLRSRSDVVPFAHALLEELAPRSGVDVVPRLSMEVEALFSRHPWPGNTRELRNTLEVALVLAAGAPEIGLEHLPPDLAPIAVKPEVTPPVDGALDEVEEWAVRRVLAEVAGNVSAAAKRLGVARSTLYRMMRRHGLGR